MHQHGRNLCPTATDKRKCQDYFLMLSFCPSDCLLYSDQTYDVKLKHGSPTTIKVCAWTTCRLAGGQFLFGSPAWDLEAKEKSFRSWQHLQLCHQTPSWGCVLLGAHDGAAANHPWQHFVETHISAFWRLVSFSRNHACRFTKMCIFHEAVRLLDFANWHRP